LSLLDLENTAWRVQEAINAYGSYWFRRIKGCAIFIERHFIRQTGKDGFSRRKKERAFSLVQVITRHQSSNRKKLQVNIRFSRQRHDKTPKNATWKEM
jgi:hypothetical protein